MDELKRADYKSVRPLFQPLQYHLTSAAVLDGTCPGRVFVDDLVRPRTAFMLSPEGCYLAGDADNLRFVRALNRAVVTDRALGSEVRVLFLIVSHAGWCERLPMFFDPLEPVEMPRRHYICRALSCDWRARLPEGCAIQRIDRELLDSPRLTLPEHVTGWMENNWGSSDGFLRHGVGLVSVIDGEIVSWSLTDCVSGDRCEIGIRTVPTQRRRGLATATAAATVEHTLYHGFAMVGWHCPDDNLGSIGTAEKVGFQRERDYVAYYAFLDE